MTCTIIEASYATGDVDGGDGRFRPVSVGLWGIMAMAAIILASYATGTDHGGIGSDDHVGGCRWWR